MNHNVFHEFFGRKKAVTSKQTSQTAQTAPVKQETPVAPNSSDISINVIGFTGDERWIFPGEAPKFPMPEKETASLLEPFPEKNAALPVGWFIPELGSDEELVFKFPDENREFLCFNYSAPAIYVQYFTFKYERDTKLCSVSSWGYDYTRKTRWQTVVKFSVQIFTSRDCERVYNCVSLINGSICMDAKMCNTSYISEYLRGTNLRIRAAYEQDYETASQTYDLLLHYASCIIATATRQYFKSQFQNIAQKHYEMIATSMEKMKELVNDAENLVVHAAIRRFYGVETTKDEFMKAQNLFDRFVELTNELDPVGTEYYKLVQYSKMCAVPIDLSRFNEMFNCVGMCILKINGLFEILRG